MSSLQTKGPILLQRSPNPGDLPCYFTVLDNPRRQKGQFFCDDRRTLRGLNSHSARGKAREEASGVGTEVSTALSRPHLCAVKRAILQPTFSTPSNHAFPPKCILGEHSEAHTEEQTEAHAEETTWIDTDVSRIWIIDASGWNRRSPMGTHG